MFLNFHMILNNLNFILLLTLLLFVIGFIGLVLNRKNFLLVLISIEIILLAINLNFILFSVYFDDLVGQIFVLFILAIAAIESSIGLAILIIYYRVHNKILVDYIQIKKN